MKGHFEKGRWIEEDSLLCQKIANLESWNDVRIYTMHSNQYGFVVQIQGITNRFICFMRPEFVGTVYDDEYDFIETCVQIYCRNNRGSDCVVR
ncbi:hypothetical protein [Bacteroides sp.]|uniref:hypothetical protein n=1 Tax=Bacteroides sp. TaxID=29523 RepID=UPI002613F04A|nr:hypothetical protein [Bacteroides sp.]MDD3039040.1 hypothetical protein [Bacteroides sp.]